MTCSPISVPPSFSWIRVNMEMKAVTSAVAKIAEATLKVAFGLWAEKSASALVEKAVAETSGEVIRALIPSVAREAATATASAIVGPLLNVLLRLTDATSAQLDKLVREPYKTGMRESAKALHPPTGSTDDEAWRRSRLQYADNQLASAFTLAEKTKNADLARLHISFVRALIALVAGAREFAKLEFVTTMDYVRAQVAIIDPEIESISRQFREWNHPVTDGREYPGASGLYSRREGLRARRANLAELGQFVETCLRELA